MKTGGDQGIQRFRGQRAGSFRSLAEQITGKLLDREKIERQVPIQGRDHPVTERPHDALVVVGIAVRIGIPSLVEPMSPPTLAKPRTRQHPIHQPLIRVRLIILQKGRDIPHARWQTEQVEVETANQGGPIRFRRRPQTMLLQRLQNEPVNRISRPLGCLHRRDAWTLDRLE